MVYLVTLCLKTAFVSAFSSTNTPTTTPTSSVQQRSANQQALEDAPPFPRTWVPLASVYELHPDRPTPLRFLGQSYVTYQSNDGHWAVFDDACPHRLAPLSEGRVDRQKNRLECSYHGWEFDADGRCQEIPQADFSTMQKAMQNERCHVKSYPVHVEKNILFVWPWADEDPLITVSEPHCAPEHFMEGVSENCTTYTRDLPYGWDTLLENIVDPSHVPFAHHGLQGKREDAIPINMTSPSDLSPEGFVFQFEDRTMSMRRQGGAVFRAPFVIHYKADFETPSKEKQKKRANSPKVFNLTAIMLPTKPGWSRIILMGAPRTKQIEKKEKERLVAKIFRKLPSWLVHTFSNRFLDSDLAFLHFQEQERERRGVDARAYFMPAQSDRCVSALRKWILQYAHIPGPLPAPLTDRGVLFNRWTQHGEHCRHCTSARKRVAKWRTNTLRLLAISLVLAKFTAARVVAALSLLLLNRLSAVDKAFSDGGFSHYDNH
jgi:phenylpropionate dioxygenase-like ring-hydroxylating dioxygenase large terminal subunit